MLHVPRVRYLEVGRMVLKQKEAVLAKTHTFSKNHVIHPPPQRWAKGIITPIDPLSIPDIQATGWSPDMDELAREPRRGPYFNQLRYFLDNPKPQTSMALSQSSQQRRSP